MARARATRRKRNGVEVHVDVGSHNARGSRGAKTNPKRRKAHKRAAARTRSTPASAAAMRKRYGARALSVAAAMRNLARTAAQRAHWSKVIRTLEGRSLARRRNPSPALPVAVIQGGAVVAGFRSLPRARQYAQALANRSGRPVRVRA